MLKSIFNLYSSRVREKRGVIFRNRLLIKEGMRILDLGGWDGSHIAKILPKLPKVMVYIADIDNSALQRAKKEYGFTPIQLDESGNIPFDDGYFDIVFSNSVIEHVTVDKVDMYKILSTNEFETKAFERQKKFAQEVRRIGKQYFVQTPNKYFFMESHSWFPNVFAFLSRKNQISLIKFLNKFWPKKTEPDWNLLTSNQIKEIFPDAEIIKEKSFGGTKSFIAIKNL